jgi:hypothetical protein
MRLPCGVLFSKFVITFVTFNNPRTSKLFVSYVNTSLFLKIVSMHVLWVGNFIPVDSISKSNLTYFKPNRCLLVVLLRNRCSR